MSRSEANHLQGRFFVVHKIGVKSCGLSGGGFCAIWRCPWGQKAVQILAILPQPRARDPCIYTIGNNSRIGFNVSAQSWRGFAVFLGGGGF